MHLVANGFVLAFVAGGAFLLADGLLQALLGFSGLAPLQRALASALALAALPVFALLAASPRLPARVFLPLVLFAGWSALGGFPLPLFVESPPLHSWLGAAQLALGFLALAQIRARSGGSWLFHAESLPGLAFAAGHSARFALAALLLGPLLLGAYLAVCLVASVHHFSAGFLSVRPSGVWAEEREYLRGDRSVHLIAMIHVGERDYYEDVIASIPADDAVILAEGVSDRQALLAEDLSYGRLAANLGLESQAEFLQPDSSQRVVSADIDLSQLSPATVELLQRVGEILESDDFAQGFARYLEFSREVPDPDVLERAWHEILDLREEHVLSQLPAALEQHHRAILPWGAAHMAGLERALLADGFALGRTHTRRIIEF